jgi:hypothetical protein
VAGAARRLEQRRKYFSDLTMNPDVKVRVVYAEMIVRIHVAGRVEDGVQTCSRCGVVLRDGEDMDVSNMLWDTGPYYFALGSLVAVDECGSGRRGSPFSVHMVGPKHVPCGKAN